MLKRKQIPSGEYRNLKLMPGRTDLFEFEVKDAGGEWHKITNIGGDDKDARLDIVTKTADHWIKRNG